MMLTIMLITDGSVRIMSYGSELTRGTSVYDFTVMGNDQIVEKYLSNEQIRPYVSNLNRMEIGNIKSTASDGISSPVDWSKFRKQIVQHLPQDVVDPATQEDGMYSFGSDQPAALNLLGLIDTGSSSPYLLPVSSYNRLLDAAGEKQISLGNNEVNIRGSRKYHNTCWLIERLICSRRAPKIESVRYLDFVVCICVKNCRASNAHAIIKNINPMYSVV